MVVIAWPHAGLPSGTTWAPPRWDLAAVSMRHLDSALRPGWVCCRGLELMALEGRTTVGFQFRPGLLFS
jgi:hypothetical protein